MKLSVPMPATISAAGRQSPRRRAAARPWPVPGLVLGDYPQRPEEPASGEKKFAGLRHAALHLELGMALGLGQSARVMRGMPGFIAAVRALEQDFASQTAVQAADRLHTLRAMLARDGATDGLLVQALATVSLACRSELGLRPHDCQLIAVRLLLDGQLAEMATGEGKTLVAGLAATVAALAGVPVHVMTANDYLVGRDAAGLQKLAGHFGLCVGAVTQTMDQAARAVAYRQDIVYCTAKELAFDYLRDCLAMRSAGHGVGSGKGSRLLRGLCMAIVDEADAILIDEARVPLVLSQAAAVPPAAEGAPNAFSAAWACAQTLQCGDDFMLDETATRALLTTAGRAAAARLAAATPGLWRTAGHCEELLGLALVACHLLSNGRQYHVRDGKVLLIDETTGRIAEGRGWSGGLQQMVECKEGCTLTPLLSTIAQITYQRLLPRYRFLCGMSGTLREARRELFQVYGLRVQAVPQHRPGRRRLLAPRVCADTATLWRAVTARVASLHASGVPVLVGTDSILDSRALSLQLHQAGLAHSLLDASQNRAEADIVAAAGQPGAITVATNLAGRGTDIGLAGGLAERGGLHVLSCQQNDAARMDRQLFGRCARQGDPGSVEVFITPAGRLTAGRQPGGILARLAVAGLGGNETVSAFAGWRGMLAAAGLRLAQAARERRQCRERLQLLRNDRRSARWFAFGGHKE